MRLYYHFTALPLRTSVFLLLAGLFTLFISTLQTAQAQFFTPPPAYLSVIVVSGDGNVPCCKNNGDAITFQYRDNRETVTPDPQIERYPVARRGSSVTVAFTYACPASSVSYSGTIRIDVPGDPHPFSGHSFELVDLCLLLLCLLLLCLLVF